MDEATKTAVSRWLIWAEHDLATARAVLAVVPPVADTACLLAATWL